MCAKSYSSPFYFQTYDEITGVARDGFDHVGHVCRGPALPAFGRRGDGSAGEVPQNSDGSDGETGLDGGVALQHRGGRWEPAVDAERVRPRHGPQSPRLGTLQDDRRRPKT